MKINVGCGQLPLDGYLNVDKYDHHADELADPMLLSYGDVDEVTMFHVLEHLSLVEGPQLVAHVAGWLRPGGKLIVEVPDMEAIMAAPGPNWRTDIYGVQTHEGEFHRSGWDAGLLADLFYQVGVPPTTVDRFLSTHPWRAGMPCIVAEGVR